MEEAERKVNASLDLLKEYADSGDEFGAEEILQVCSTWTVAYLVTRLSQEQEMFVNKLSPAFRGDGLSLVTGREKEMISL